MWLYILTNVSYNLNRNHKDATKGPILGRWLQDYPQYFTDLSLQQRSGLQTCHCASEYIILTNFIAAYNNRTMSFNSDM